MPDERDDLLDAWVAAGCPGRPLLAEFNGGSIRRRGVIAAGSDPRVAPPEPANRPSLAACRADCCQFTDPTGSSSSEMFPIDVLSGYTKQW